MSLTKTSNQVIQSPYRKNFLINGGFNIWQRGVSFSATGRVADRWRLSHNASSVSVIKSDSAATPINGASIVRLQLTTKGGSFTDCSMSQALESRDSYILAGKTVTFSIWLRRNSAFNAGAARINIYSGTGTDEATVDTNRTDNYVDIPYSSISITDWTRFSITATIGATKTQVGVVFRMRETSTPDGSYIDAWGAQLEIGATATDFEFRHFAEELNLCQRYYEKSYNLDVVPGTVTSAGRTIFYAGNVNYYHTAYFKVRKRATSAVIAIYSPVSGASGNIYNHTTALDVAITAGASSESAFEQRATVSALGNLISFQWTADSEL